MNSVNLNEIKARFSKYIEMVEAGETVIVCKRNVPVAEIRPIARRQKKTPELGWIKRRPKLSAGMGEWSKQDQVAWEGDKADPLRTSSAREHGTLRQRRLMLGNRTQIFDW
jgi:prevent-host-death family protein